MGGVKGGAFWEKESVGGPLLLNRFLKKGKRKIDAVGWDLCLSQAEASELRVMENVGNRNTESDEGFTLCR